MLDPIYEEKVTGSCRGTPDLQGIRRWYRLPAAMYWTVSSCRNCQVRIVRDGIVVYEGDLESLRRFKDDVKEVAAGYECGLVFKKFNDVQGGRLDRSLHHGRGTSLILK